MRQLDWNATLDTIRETLPKAQFQNWFKPLRFIRSDAHRVILGVPNRFHEQWLRSNYAAQLKEAILNQCGESLQLEFEIEVEEENVEASHSETPVGLATTQPVTRPSLRIIHGLQTEEKPADSPAPTDCAELPVYQNTFFELEFNYLASQCASLISKEVAFNPLVIQAGVGMGKTHLLARIGEMLQKNEPGLRIRYATAETFTAEMVQGFRNDTIFAFKQKFRDQTDCLLFDDLQLLEKRQRSQEELVYIFNEITARGGRVIFATSVAPDRFENFIEPLRSRLLSGVLAEVKLPSYDDRLKLLQLKAEEDAIHVGDDVLRSIASNSQNDIRGLVGTLIRLHLQSKLQNRVLNTEFITQQQLLPHKTQQEAVTLAEIITLVENMFAVTREELLSKSRQSKIAWARQVAMYLARHYTLLPLEQIGKSFGRDHATVIHAFAKVKETTELNATRRYEVEFLKKKLNARCGTL